MKKLSVILASLVLFTGISFASPIQKAEKKETTKKDDKKAVKKVPAKKKAEKKDDKAAK
jgi:hypothetical protein